MEAIDWTIPLKLAAVVALVVANGFFVASEFCLVALRRSRIVELQNNGHWLGPSLFRANEQLDAYLAATQLGITLASIGLGWIGKPAVAVVLSPVFSHLPAPFNILGTDGAAFVVGFTLITVLHIVFGELLPKSLAIQKAEAVALVIVRPLAVFLWVFHPAIAILNGFANWVLRCWGLNPASGEQHLHSPEELKLLWRAVSDAGLVHAEQGSLVDRAFALGERKIASCMTPRRDFEWVDPDADLAEIRDQVIASAHSLFPVRVSDDAVPSIVSAKRILSLNFNSGRLPEHIIQPAELITETAGALRILEHFRQSQTEMALVLDEYGVIVGLVTTHDLYDALAGKPTSLPSKSSVLEHGPERSWQQTFDAGIPIDEFRRLLKRPQLGCEDKRPYHTVAGFVLERMKCIPREGARFRYDNLIFEVRKMSKRRITEISVTASPATPLPETADPKALPERASRELSPGQAVATASRAG